jgi:ribosomal protein L9
LPRKAKNAPPWTKKKLHRYRAVKEAQRLEERERAKAAKEEMEKSGRFVDAVLVRDA